MKAQKKTTALEWAALCLTVLTLITVVLTVKQEIKQEATSSEVVATVSR